MCNPSQRRYTTISKLTESHATINSDQNLYHMRPFQRYNETYCHTTKKEFAECLLQTRTDLCYPTKIKIHRTVNWPLYCTGIKLGLSHKVGKHRLKLLENGILRGIFEPTRDEVTEGWKNCIMRSLKINTSYQR
jgi:hypothetical protein